jgi:hypothetical protein
MPSFNFVFPGFNQVCVKVFQSAFHFNSIFLARPRGQASWGAGILISSAFPFYHIDYYLGVRDIANNIWLCAIAELTFFVSCLRNSVYPFARSRGQTKLILVEHSQIEINLSEIESVLRENTEIEEMFKTRCIVFSFLVVV